MSPPLATLIQLFVELDLLLLHISVSICVLRQYRGKHRVFRTDFFAIYLMQSLAEEIYVVMVCLNETREWVGTHIFQILVFLKTLQMGYLVDFYSPYPFTNMCFFVLTYGEGFQQIAHAVIALNRYMVLARQQPVLEASSVERYLIWKVTCFRPSQDLDCVLLPSYWPCCPFQAPLHASPVPSGWCKWHPSRLLWPTRSRGRIW